MLNIEEEVNLLETSGVINLESDSEVSSSDESESELPRNTEKS